MLPIHRPSSLLWGPTHRRRTCTHTSARTAPNLCKALWRQGKSITAVVTTAANYFALRMACLQVAHMRTHVQHAARWCIQQKFPAKFKSRIVRPTESSVAPTDGPCRTDHKWRLHQTAELHGTDRDCRPRPPVPSVAFGTYKKTTRKLAVLKDGPGLRATAPVPNVAF